MASHLNTQKSVLDAPKPTLVYLVEHTGENRAQRRGHCIRMKVPAGVGSDGVERFSRRVIRIGRRPSTNETYRSKP